MPCARSVKFSLKIETFGMGMVDVYSTTACMGTASMWAQRTSYIRVAIRQSMYDDQYEEALTNDHSYLQESV